MCELLVKIPTTSNNVCVPPCDDRQQNSEKKIMNEQVNERRKNGEQINRVTLAYTKIKEKVYRE